MDRRAEPPATWRDVLSGTLAREGAEMSATESLRRAHDDAESLATLVPGYEYAAALAGRDRVDEVIADPPTRRWSPP